MFLLIFDYLFCTYMIFLLIHFYGCASKINLKLFCWKKEKKICNRYSMNRVFCFVIVYFLLSQVQESKIMLRLVFNQNTCARFRSTTLLRASFFFFVPTVHYIEDLVNGGQMKVKKENKISKIPNLRLKRIVVWEYKI